MNQRPLNFRRFNRKVNIKSLERAKLKLALEEVKMEIRKILREEKPANP